MPNDVLIETLEQLRETYNQRQRATNNLLSALKGTTSAVGKTSRALRDYADQTSADGGPIAGALDTFAPGAPAVQMKDDVIDPLVSELRREVKGVGASFGALKDAQAALRGEVVDVVKLGRAVAVLRSNAARDQSLAAVVPDLDQELEQAQHALADTFGRGLRDALAAQGIEIGGRPPSFEIGRFALQTDFVNRLATLSYGKHLVARRVPLSIEAVLRAYETAQKSIMGRNEDPARWIENLHTAWSIAILKREASGRSAAGRANIVECYYEMTLLRQSRAFRSAPGKNIFADYSRAQFAHDFFEYAIEQGRTHAGKRVVPHSATKSQTDNDERSLWLVEGKGPNDGRFFGDVGFGD